MRNIFFSIANDIEAPKVDKTTPVAYVHAYRAAMAGKAPQGLNFVEKKAAGAAVARR